MSGFAAGNRGRHADVIRHGRFLNVWPLSDGTLEDAATAYSPVLALLAYYHIHLGRCSEVLSDPRLRDLYDKGRSWVEGAGDVPGEALFHRRAENGPPIPVSMGATENLDNLYVTTGTSMKDSCAKIKLKITQEMVRTSPRFLMTQVKPDRPGAWGRLLKMPLLDPAKGDFFQLYDPEVPTCSPQLASE